jgi:TolB-like protein
MYRRLVLLYIGLSLVLSLPALADRPNAAPQDGAIVTGSKNIKAGEKVVVAVADFAGDDTQIRDAITQTFTVDLIKGKRLQVVERERLVKVMAEQNLDNSGLVDPERAAAIGKLVGARKMIVAGFNRVGSAVSLDARLVDVETGKVEEGGAEQVIGRIQGEGEDIYALAHQLATRFHRAISGEWLPHVVVSSRAGIGPGRDSNVDPLAMLEQGDRGIRLEVKLDRKEGSTYRWGEKMRISFRVDAPCHVYLFNVDTTRQVTQLYPNEWHRDEKVQAGRWYQVPGPGEEWELVIEGEMGIEEIIAVASSRPLQLNGQSSIAMVSKSAAQFAGKTVVPRLRETPAAWAGKRVRFYTAKK